MDLFDKLAKRLAEEYKNYETRIEAEEGISYFVIVNPFWEENIRISTEDGIIFYFSYQHDHFDYYAGFNENIGDLINYINSYLNGERVCVEVFHEDENIFGGDRYLQDMDISSGEAWLKSFIGYNAEVYESIYEHIKGRPCRCSIRSWNSAFNKDIDFVL